QWVADDAGEMPPRRLRILRVRRNAGSDRRGAEADFAQVRHDLGKLSSLLLDRQSKRLELLTERHRRGVLELRAPDLYNADELARLVPQCSTERTELHQETLGR